MEVKASGVKFKDFVILNSETRRKKIADEANKCVEMVDDLVNFIKTCLKSFEDTFKNPSVTLVNNYFKTKPIIENKDGQKRIYKLFRKYPDIVLNGDFKKAFNAKFKKNTDRMEEINDN